jgi:integrase
MAKNRGSGEGSIYLRKDGRWCAAISLECKPGEKPKRKLVYGKTRDEVARSLKRILNDQQNGVLIASKSQSVGQFLPDWLENVVKLKNRQTTHRSYEWIVRNHLIPHLGRIQLAKLTPQRLQAFINERCKSGLSPTTVKHFNATLKAALSQAQKWGLVHQNAAKLVTLPRGVRYQPVILTPLQARSFLTFVSGDRLEGLYAVALCLGLRRGETLGLRWSDVDLEKGTLKVRHSLERVKGEGLRLSEPKSERSRRGLRIPSICLTALIAHHARQAREREWAGSKWRDLDFVFTTSLGTPMHPDDITRAFPATLKAAGLPKVRFHDLRHSCATLLFSLGVSAKLVQETLGHSTYQLTMDTYSHMLPELRNEVADKMDEIFSPQNQVAVKVAVKPKAETVN